MSLQLVQKQEYPHIVDVSTDERTDQTYIKAFLMDDTVNRNFWHVPAAVMKKYASSFIGRPWIVHPSGDHPNYLKEGVAHDSKTFIEDVLNVQDRYKAGEIIDVTYEPTKENPDKKAFFATIRVTNPDIMGRLRSGALSSYVSPQIYDLSKANPGEPTTEFVPLHVASVNEPAYGNVARIRALCNGSGPVCAKQLKSAALQLVHAIDNSSFFQNSDSGNYRLTNPNNYYQQQADPQELQRQQQQYYAVNGFNPTQQYGNASGVDQNGQLISQKTQTQEVDQHGNLITRIEDKKPRGNSQTKTQQQPQIIANPEQSQPVQTQPPQQIVQDFIPAQNPQNPTPNTNTQSPNEILEAIKGLQASIQGVTDRVTNIEQFKKSAEDEKMKKASEAQRQIIESVFTPEVIQDEAAREDVVNYFVGLPLSDEDLQKILDMIVTGTFNSATTGAAADTQQASKPNKVGRPKGSGGNVKQASVNLNRLIMQNVESYNPSPSAMARSFFGDIDVDNIR